MRQHGCVCGGGGGRTLPAWLHAACFMCARAHMVVCHWHSVYAAGGGLYQCLSTTYYRRAAVRWWRHMCMYVMRCPCARRHFCGGTSPNDCLGLQRWACGLRQPHILDVLRGNQHVGVRHCGR